MVRRKWSTEKKMNIVLEGMAPGGNISEVCRTHGILQPSTTSGEISFAVMDAFDKEMIGYKFSRFCRTDELLFAVNQAIRTRFPNGVKDQGLTIRSDNGCQMTSRRYMKALKDAGIKQERTGYNNLDADAVVPLIEIGWFQINPLDGYRR